MGKWARNTVALFLWAFLVVASLVLPTSAYAVGTAADLQCVGTAQCPVGMGPGPNGPCASAGGGTIGKVCVDTTSGFTTQGVCISTIPPKCHANNAPGLNGGNSLSSMGQLLGQVGGLLSKLLQGQQQSSSPNTPTGTGCTSYTPTSDPTQVGVNPCVYYVPSAASQITPGTTGITGSTGNTSAQDLLNALNGTSGTNSASGSSSTILSAQLSASPSSGSSPLSVIFTTSPISGSDTYTIDPGDGSGPQSAAPAGSCSANSASTCVFGLSYTYVAAGTYTAVLSSASGGQIATASISVTNPGGASTNAASPLSQVFNSVGGLLAGTSTQGTQGMNGQSSTNFPGVLGNILLNSNGATIFASTINSANNSETSGFYGSDTLGSQPQGVVSSMCQGRPWASNFLANIIPPSFFDSLCQWGGFQVGQPQPVQTPTKAQPQVTLTQQISSAPAHQSAPQATSTTPSVPAQAVIWAVPASVPLGTRTSIFWNTQGVAQCTETSPDGSFNESSLSGAAATVPLTGATTFTISCTDSSGNPITDFVTVNISS